MECVVDLDLGKFRGIEITTKILGIFEEDEHALTSMRGKTLPTGTIIIDRFELIKLEKKRRGKWGIETVKEVSYIPKYDQPRDNLVIWYDKEFPIYTYI
ncbi:MAG: hypothetical protein AMQ74_01626 [Candidatus Methanofastidiosum methylothiophilum]|uniref:Uncharacterized protein n=1 Tax=Candidatus Methanofastidiosum methylothiophilum TaxID=1705564 RepID=A0A150ITA7_9EURY|nr:MAG: hypothetical protein AMQ74_01626 [Candidatus Methanofastidiosum methylthiophilus]